MFKSNNNLLAKKFSQLRVQFVFAVQNLIKKSITFLDEYRALLKNFDILFDEIIPHAIGWLKHSVPHGTVFIPRILLQTYSPAGT